MTYLLAIAAATLLRAVAIAAAIARATVVRLRLVAQAIAGIATRELGQCKPYHKLCIHMFVRGGPLTGIVSQPWSCLLTSQGWSGANLKPQSSLIKVNKPSQTLEYAHFFKKSNW